MTLSTINILTSYAGLRAYAIEQGSSPAAPVAGVLLNVLSSFVFWYFIVQRASNVAKWLLVVFSALSIFAVPEAITLASSLGWIYGITFTASAIPLVIALTMLFRQDAIEWLTDRDIKVPVDPSVFL